MAYSEQARSRRRCTGTTKAGRTLRRLGSLGRPTAALCEPLRPPPHRGVAAGLRAAATTPRAVHPVHVRGLPLATQAFRWALPLARTADLPVHDAGRHTSLATLAEAPTTARARKGRQFELLGQRRGDLNPAALALLLEGLIPLARCVGDNPIRLFVAIGVLKSDLQRAEPPIG